MADIFLSYSHEDLATARRFAKAFERAGFSVWWDRTLHSGDAYDRITETIAPGKPLIISEVGCSEYGGSKAQWISQALESARTNYPLLRGLLWFEKYDDGMDWPIETSASSANAFADAIQSPAYLAESVIETAQGPIEPPASTEATEALFEPLG